MKAHTVRRYAWGDARRARSAIRRARKEAHRAREYREKAEGEANASTAEIYRSLAGGCDRAVGMYVRNARRAWRGFLGWRRVYRATERGDHAESARLLRTF